MSSATVSTKELDGGVAGAVEEEAVNASLYIDDITNTRHQSLSLLKCVEEASHACNQMPTQHHYGKEIS